MSLSDRELRGAMRLICERGGTTRERVEGFHHTTMTAVMQTPEDSLATVWLTPPQPLALLASLRCSSTVRASSDEPSFAPLTKTSRGFVSRPSQGSGTLDDARHGG